MRFQLLLLSLLLTAFPCLSQPLIIGHRGASGYLPEHTLEAYRLAVEQGADYIEPDLVPTRDGHLVARHENNIADTTDVALHPEFASRKAVKQIDGKRVEGWFTEDFTLEELKTLRALGRNRASRAFDRKFEIVTLAEILQAVRAWERELKRPIGIYPETKHPSYFRHLGLPLEETLVDQLHEAGYLKAEDPVILQSFEVGNLQYLKTLTSLPLAQLVDDSGAPQDWVESNDPRNYRHMLTPEGLREIAQYAQIVAPYKGLLMQRGADGEWGAVTPVIAEAHKLGLKVHSWTFRAENQFLAPSHRRGNEPEGEGDLTREIVKFLQAGLDGFFCNHPDQGVRARALGK